MEENTCDGQGFTIGLHLQWKEREDSRALHEKVFHTSSFRLMLGY